MTISRFKHTVCLYLIRGARRRADYCKKHHLYHQIGSNCSIQSRSVPLFSQLISIHDNVHLASGVSFITHDIVHRMVNNMVPDDQRIGEYVGCIEIMDNVFVGAGARIMYNTRIGENCVIGAGSVVTKDLAPNGVYAGVPARFICSFSDFLSRRKLMDEELRALLGSGSPKVLNQHIDEESVERIWERFMEEKDEFSKD